MFKSFSIKIDTGYVSSIRTRNSDKPLSELRVLIASHSFNFSFFSMLIIFQASIRMPCYNLESSTCSNESLVFLFDANFSSI